MADFSSFVKSPFLLYSLLSLFDAVRLLTYNFALFETLLWWFITLSTIVFIGDFGSYSNFFTRASFWLKNPTTGFNFYKLVFCFFFLAVLPFF
jgi:hypothetical protein